MRKYIVWSVLILIVLVVIVFWKRLDAAASVIEAKLGKQKTVAERLAQYGPAARARWRPYFDQTGLSYPPFRVVLVGIKDQKQLQIYAQNKEGATRLVRLMPIRAASGKLGPKLREGDRQVPEGVYAIESLNPNSSFHLALRVGYPNELDRHQAKLDGRTNLGSDIMIHGNAVSIGCLAMGDEGAEDLFVLAGDVGLKQIAVVISPVDFRKAKKTSELPKEPAWVKALYSTIEARLRELPAQ